MRRLFLLSVVLGAVVAVAGCNSAPGATPSSVAVPGSPSASAPPTASPGQAVFESERYGYRLAHPADWRVEAVPGVGGLHPGEAGVDTFDDGRGHILSVVGEAASGLAGWTCAINRHLVGEHALKAESVETLSVAGVPARLSSYHLVIDPYVTHYLSVEVVRGGRGLTVSLESTTDQDDEDRALLDSLLASLTLTGD